MNTRLPLVVAVFMAGCTPSATPEPPKSKPTKLEPIEKQAISRLQPARWLLTEGIGAFFDEAETTPSPIPYPEPAIVLGKRVLLTAGILSQTFPDIPSGEDLNGFRSLPAYLGGGYVFWSGSTTYHAPTFGGELQPIAAVAASGGVRPFLQGILLRTNHGFASIHIDPKTGTSKTLDAKLPPGTADAIAAGTQRAVALDMLGRIQITKDGGTSWLGTAETRATLGQSLSLGDAGEILINRTSGEPPLRLLPNGSLETAPSSSPDFRSRFSGFSGYTPQLLEPVNRRTLAPELYAHAIVAGALLPGNRVVVPRERGLSLLSTVSGRIISDTELPTVAEPFRRCQATLAGSDILLLCTHNRGSHVLRLSGDIARPELEATFPTTGSFVGDASGHLAYTGRCGQTPPSAADFRQKLPTTPSPTDTADPMAGMIPSPYDRPPEEPSPEELQPEDISPDDARACIRLSDGTWLERRLQGDDARRLHRWIPGNNGQLTALVFDIPLPKTKGASSANTPPASNAEGVRVVRLDPRHPDLRGAQFFEPQKVLRDPPYTSLDRDIWLEDDGTIRAWVALPDAGERPEDGEFNNDPPRDEPSDGENTAEGDIKPKLPLTDKLGGRIAGLSISPTGKLTLSSLPEGTEQVVRGGLYALAFALKEDNEQYFESTDGGKTFQPILKPPVGRFEAPYDSSTPFGCSPLGCTIGSGLIRLGWGSPLPPPPTPPSSDTPPSFSSGPPPREEGIRLRCHVEGDVEPWKLSSRDERRAASGKQAQQPLTILNTASGAMGSLVANTWTADILAPFQPSGAFKKVSIKDTRLTAVTGFIAPILSDNRHPIELLAIASKMRLRLSQNSPKFLPLDYSGRITAAADWKDGNLLALDFERGALLLLPPNAPAQTILRLQRVSDPGFSRLALARRPDGAFELVAYSAVTGAMFSATLDLGRAEAGPFEVLPSLDTLGQADSEACRALLTAPDTHRFIAEMPIRFTFLNKKGNEEENILSFGSVLITTSSKQACLEGIESRIPKPEPVFISAVFGPRGSEATFRTLSGLHEKAQCRLEP